MKQQAENDELESKTTKMFSEHGENLAVKVLFIEGIVIAGLGLFMVGICFYLKFKDWIVTQARSIARRPEALGAHNTSAGDNNISNSLHMVQEEGRPPHPRMAKAVVISFIVIVILALALLIYAFSRKKEENS